MPSSSPPQQLNGRDQSAREDDEDDEMDEDVVTPDDQQQAGLASSPFDVLKPSKGLKMQDTWFSQSQGMGMSLLGQPAKDSMRLSIRSLGEETQKRTDIGLIAQGMARSMEAAPLRESDELILGTERLMSQLHSLETQNQVLVKKSRRVISELTLRLSDLWESQAITFGTRSSSDGEAGLIGPGEDAPGIEKASFVTSLLFPLQNSPAISAAPLNLSKLNTTSNFALSHHSQPMPKVLLDWLHKHHDPYPGLYQEVRDNPDGATGHERFWDLVFMSLLRGKINEAAKLLRFADFSQAVSALEDGYDTPGYRGAQLSSVDQVVGRCIKVLEACPAAQQGDWEVTGQAWRFFRIQVNQALDDLEAFAEGSIDDRDAVEDAFEAENFNLSKGRTLMALSTASRKAQSTVPWQIYTSLKALYGQLLGTPDEIIASAADWVEATIGLAAWWDGENEDLRVTGRSSHRRSGRNLDVEAPRSSKHDDDQVLAYKRRLAWALAKAEETGEAIMAPNTVNSIEVALACVFVDDVPALGRLLKGWSMVAASAVVELALAWGFGESNLSKARSLAGFNKSDLMVLSYNIDEDVLAHDETLQEYADMLTAKPSLRDGNRKSQGEGWEYGLRVLGRLQNRDTSNNAIGTLLSSLNLESPARVDRILAITSAMGALHHGLSAAERYADQLASTTHNYGDAIFYYARAHNQQKLRSVLDLLVSLCLVHSIAYPSPSGLDQRLRLLLENPAMALSELSRIDTEAAEMISTYLSGYATARRFYDVRDEGLTSDAHQKPKNKPKQRRKLAANALVAVVESASSSVRGGLYDAQTDSVVQVDGLLSLLGEALLFISQPEVILTQSQLFTLLKAVEDLQTAPDSVQAQCEELLEATISSYNSDDQDVADTRDILKKSMMDGSQESVSASRLGFSMAGSEMLLRSGLRKNGSQANSGVLVKSKVRRAWDWRSGFADGAGGEDVCRVLRLGLAREMGRCWMQGAT